MLSYPFYTFLTQQIKLPVLNIPFFLVSTIIYLASARYSSLIVDSFYYYEGFNYYNLPMFIQGLLKTTGHLVFMPYDLTGFLVLLALMFNSMMSFILLVFSYYTGIFCLSLLKGSMTQAFHNPAAFNNFILIGIALGGIFLIPSRRSYGILHIPVNTFFVRFVLCRDARQCVSEQRKGKHFLVLNFKASIDLSSLGDAAVRLYKGNHNHNSGKSVNYFSTNMKDAEVISYP